MYQCAFHHWHHLRSSRITSYYLKSRGPYTVVILRLSCVRDRWMSMEHWRNNTAKGKRKQSGKSLSQCQFVHQKSHGYGLGSNPGVCRETPTNRLGREPQNFIACYCVLSHDASVLLLIWNVVFPFVSCTCCDTSGGRQTNDASRRPSPNRPIHRPTTVWASNTGCHVMNALRPKKQESIENIIQRYDHMKPEDVKTYCF